MRDRSDRSHREVRYYHVSFSKSGRETHKTHGVHTFYVPCLLCKRKVARVILHLFICFKIHVAANYFTHANAHIYRDRLNIFNVNICINILVKKYGQNKSCE
jgi:hypothetical protein